MATTPLVAVVAVAAAATERADAAASASTTWAAPQLDLQRSLLIAPQAAPLCFPFLACAHLPSACRPAYWQEA